ncbi:MAG: DNA polymerase III subunit gamma/tau [Candidatus Izemoplasmatales bacterium]
MSYKALYRIYRPADFDQVAGQKHITQTLKNALKNDRVAHAYLFSGPRGTGKTSIAKIFAKAVNCEEAPTDNPCNVCENCMGISNNSISDVIEIDAASNNGVDEIRELRDKVKYLPGYVKYKVYIIDEVHMLSTGAFNALLKTLEEPPQHVIFILCTTEPQKIPATIHSRCQRFDFKSISNADIIDKLFEIAEEENIEITEEAVKQIANYAEGGLRDAISLLDQVYAYSPKKIDVDDVNEICGTVSVLKLLEMVDSIVKKEPAISIKLLSDLISEGKEIKKITLDLIDFFKNVLVYKNLNRLNEFSIYDNLEEFKSFAKALSSHRLFLILDILNQTLNEMNWSGQPKTYLELAFLKMTDQESSDSEVLFEKIDELKNRIAYLENSENDPIKFRTEVSDKEEVLPSKISKPIIKTLDKDKEEKKIQEETFEDETSKETLIENIEKKDENKNLNPNTKEDIKNDICDDISNTYDIEFVEEVLNNGDIQDRKYLNDEWQGFERGLTEKDEKYLASLLETGKVVASKKNKIIITFSSATICNKLMEPDNKEKLQNILYNKFDRDIQYMALPINVFEDITNEFKEHYQKGEKNIKLSKIYCEGLKDVSKIKSTKDEREAKVVADAKNIFGDLVRVKD